MPFKSKAQRAACYAKGDPKWDCKAYEGHKAKKTPKRKKKTNAQKGTQKVRRHQR